MAQIEQDRRHGGPSTRRLKESIVERACKLACVAALIVMLVVIGVDILTRSLFNFSFEISDELGGYMLVVITFVSLPVCQINDSFHHVELVQSRLSPFARAVSHVIFDLLSLAFCALLLWQLVEIRALLVPLRRSRADLSGDAALDPANRDDARRGGVVLLHCAHACGRRCPPARDRQDGGARR